MLAGIALLTTLVAIAGHPARSEAQGTSDDFLYYDSNTSVESSLSSESDCVFGDRHFAVGGGVLLPFEYRPAQLVNNFPVTSFDGSTGGWNTAVIGKGIDDPTPVTTWMICSDVKTSIRSEKFALPADGKVHSRTVSCGKGERALSGGVGSYPKTLTDDGSRAIVESYPVDGPDKGHGRGDAWRVAARAGRPSSTKAEAAVICVKASKMQVRYPHLDFSVHHDDLAGVYVDCRDSEQVVGGGVHVEKPKSGIRLTSYAPFDSGNDADTTPSDRWVTAVDGPHNGRTDATNWAVCTKVR